MIEFHYETDFQLEGTTLFADWVNRIIISEGAVVKQVDYIFCDDEYLLGINKKHLGHDTYTDIITFDYTEGGGITGDIFISTDRVRENANNFNVNFDEELMRVMSHGLLHLLGYKDKSEKDSVLMRKKENEKIEMFHVEQ